MDIKSDAEFIVTCEAFRSTVGGGDGVVDIAIEQSRGVESRESSVERKRGKKRRRRK